jgi:hypothetical protein
MKKKAKAAPRDEETASEPLYLRKAGDKVAGAFPYMAFDAKNERTIVVRATSRDMAKYKVWQALGGFVRFWR